MNQAVLRGYRLFFAGLLALAVGSQVSVCRADLVVAPGWDLYITPVTNIGGTDFVGDPFAGNSFNFGGSIGSQNVGNTDTIIQRTGTASVGVPATVQIVALELRTVNPVDLGALDGFAGPHTYYATLSGLPQATALETINFTNDTGGTFSASIPVSYVLRRDAPTNPEVLGSQGNTNINFVNATWGRLRPSIAAAGPAIDNVNFTLKADNTTDQDFWAGATAAVPEPSLAFTTFLSIAGIGFASVKRRLRGKKKEASETQAV